MIRYFSWNFYNNTRLPVLELGFTDGGDPYLGGVVVSYLSSGHIDLSLYTNWNLTEISQQDALDIATKVSPFAFIKEDGRIDLSV